MVDESLEFKGDSASGGRGASVFFGANSGDGIKFFLDFWVKEVEGLCEVVEAKEGKKPTGEKKRKRGADAELLEEQKVCRERIIQVFTNDPFLYVFVTMVLRQMREDHHKRRSSGVTPTTTPTSSSSVTDSRVDSVLTNLLLQTLAASTIGVGILPSWEVENTAVVRRGNSSDLNDLKKMCSLTIPIGLLQVNSANSPTSRNVVNLPRKIKTLVCNILGNRAKGHQQVLNDFVNLSTNLTKARQRYIAAQPTTIDGTTEEDTRIPQIPEDLMKVREESLELDDVIGEFRDVLATAMIEVLFSSLNYLGGNNMANSSSTPHTSSSSLSRGVR